MYIVLIFPVQLYPTGIKAFSLLALPCKNSSSMGPSQFRFCQMLLYSAQKMPYIGLTQSRMAQVKAFEPEDMLVKMFIIKDTSSYPIQESHF